MAAMRTSLSASAGLVQLPARVAFKPASKAQRNMVAKASAPQVGANGKAGRVRTWSLANSLLRVNSGAAGQVFWLFWTDRINRLLCDRLPKREIYYQHLSMR
jgi:hypothetical protein